MKNLAVLISNAGTGSNLQAIIEGINSKKINARINVVISSDGDAYGLVRTKENNIKTEIVKKDELESSLSKYNIDYICLAGWKLIVPDEIIKKYKILNLHPGLIPDKIDGFVYNPDKTKGIWNRGKLTDVAIKNFLDNNATYAGSTIHFLSNQFDFGEVLGKTFEKIKKNDSVESLYKRLKKKENKMYVDVLSKICK
jgi:phosphoribosylglycinamide formyltransferase-1